MNQVLNPPTETKSTSQISKKDQWIQDLVEAEFALTPLIPGTKKPIEKAFPNTKPDPLLTGADFPDNYGVVLTAEIVVVDVDPRNFQTKEGEKNALVRLFSEAGFSKKPDTYTIRTGGGGYHFYFKKHTHLRLKGTLEGWDGIELKSRGFQLVGPGSIHPDTGEMYKVVRGHPSNLAEWPETLTPIFERVDAPSGLSLSEEDDSESNKHRYVQMLERTEGAVMGHGSDSKTLKMAMRGRDLGLPEETTFDLLRDYWNIKCTPNWPLHKLRKKVKNAYNYASGGFGEKNPKAVFESTAANLDELEKQDSDSKWDRVDKDKLVSEQAIECKWILDAKGNLSPNMTNLLYELSLPSYKSFINPLKDLFRMNLFSGNIEFTRRAPWHKNYNFTQNWSDNDAVMLKAFFALERGWNLPTALIHEAVVCVSQYQAYHPVREYLENLEWDGVERIPTWLNKYTGAIDSTYTSEVGRIALIGAVQRVFQPGSQMDYMMILEGEQGTGKSTLVRILGGEFYTDIHLNPHDKDTIMYLRGKWIAEVSEMVFVKKVDSEAMKSFLTRVTDRIRLPYDRIERDIPRQSVFIGTINPDNLGYLNDSTGNRRYLPIKTGVIDIFKLRADRDQLWAEAYQMYKSGSEPYIRDRKIIEVVETEQNARKIKEPWAKQMMEYIDIQYMKGADTRYINPLEIGKNAIGFHGKEVGRYQMSRVMNGLQQLGWRYADVIDKAGNRLMEHPSYNREMTDDEQIEALIDLI